MARAKKSTRRYVLGVYRGITWAQIFYLVKREILFPFSGQSLLLFREKVESEMGRMLQLRSFRSVNAYKKINALVPRIKRRVAALLTARRRSEFMKIPPFLSTQRETLLDVELRKVREILVSMGMRYFDSREIVTYEDNFDNLNIPWDHPAREEHSFFPVDERFMLRSQVTSSHSNSKLYERSEEMLFTVGRAFRDDKDATHLKAFYQVEWLIKRDRSLRWFLDMIRSFFRMYFDDLSLDIYIRPSFFPFTYSSFEIDVVLADQVYEVAGAGFMNRPTVKRSTVWPALAYGLERLVMIKYGLRDINDCYQIVENVT